MISTVFQNASTSIPDMHRKTSCWSLSDPCLIQSSSSIICFIVTFSKKILSCLQTVPSTSQFPPIIHPSTRNKARDGGGPAGWWISHDGLGGGLYNRPGNSQASDGRLLQSLFSVTFHDQHWTPKSALTQRKPAGLKCEDSLETTLASLPCQLFCLTC